MTLRCGVVVDVDDDDVVDTDRCNGELTRFDILGCSDINLSQISSCKNVFVPKGFYKKTLDGLKICFRLTDAGLAVTYRSSAKITLKSAYRHCRR